MRTLMVLFLNLFLFYISASCRNDCYYANKAGLTYLTYNDSLKNFTPPKGGSQFTEDLIEKLMAEQ